MFFELSLHLSAVDGTALLMGVSSHLPLSYTKTMASTCNKIEPNMNQIEFVHSDAIG